jgi:hypothetical protein
MLKRRAAKRLILQVRPFLPSITPLSYLVVFSSPHSSPSLRTLSQRVFCFVIFVVNSIQGVAVPKEKRFEFGNILFGGPW